MTLDVDEVREHVETTLGDDALQRLIDAAYEAIAMAAGAEGDITEYRSPGPGPLFMLARPASAIVDLTECDIALAEDDYELLSGQQVRRLRDGTNPSWRWRGRVRVTYTPLLATERDRAAIALIELDLNYAPGITSERIGEWQETQAAGGGSSYDEQRAAILASLGGVIYA